MESFDISRINFDPKKHYSGLRIQQGRVLSDDDWNENERIHHEDDRRSRVDIIGAYGSPDEGFRIDEISGVTGLNDAGRINFLIRAGVIYLGGVRIVLDENETYRLQKDWLQQPFNLDMVPAFNTPERFDLVYLEVWQQAVSAVEDSSLFEVALGGPDTSTRIRTMRRVHIAAGVGFCDCSDAWHTLIKKWDSENLGQVNEEFERITDARLQVSFADAGLPEDLCTPNAAGGYLGAENQAIRVQIVGKDRFTWGFDNAAPLYRVTVSENNQVHMLTEPKDQYHWPLSNQVIEILAWSALLPNGEKVAEQSGHLSKVDASYDPDTGIFTLADPLPAGFGTDWQSRSDQAELQKPAEFFYMRAWNRGNDLSSGPTINFTPNIPVTLGHTGLQVTFTGKDFVAQDYWVIAARPETPNLVVPWELEIKPGIAHHGVRRFFAPLAIISWTVFNRDQVIGKIMHDCRIKFSPLTEQECCCTYTVGDGVRSRGDFSSIQDAVNSLPESGGKICVLPGVHSANVRITNRRQIHISGCGDQSIVRAQAQQNTDPIFFIENSQKIQIEQLTLYAIDGIAVLLKDRTDEKIRYSENIKINNNQVIALIQAIRIEASDIGRENNISILYNLIGMLDNEKGDVAIFSVADKVLIERNRIVVIPPLNRDDPGDPRNDDPGDEDPFDPCRDPAIAFRPGFGIKYLIYILLRYARLYTLFQLKPVYKTKGGIQIGGTSERVRILMNEIIGGSGNGITLGHADKTPSPDFKFNVRGNQYIYSALYEIVIDENQIMQMGLSGISTLLDAGTDLHYVHVEDITIYRNTIKQCAFMIPAEIPQTVMDHWAFGGIVLSDCENAQIQENRVELNGQVFGDAVCGIFILLGEKTAISNNRIIDNGMAEFNTIILINISTKPGKRGGIIVAMSFKIADIKNSANEKWPSFDGIPAVKVHDNIVVQPLGHALYLVAYGPVSVLGNQFTSLGSDKTNAFSRLAGSVFIFNLGVSKDLPVIALRNVANGNAYTSKNQSPGRAFQFLPNGKVMFSDNQTTLDMRSATRNISYSSQLIFSLDDVAFNNNQSECAGFISPAAENETASFDIVLFNTVLYGVSVRSNDNRFSDGLSFTIYSLLSYAFMNTATGNQATHCLVVLGNLRMENSNLILVSNNDICNERSKGISNYLAVPAGKG